MGGNKNPEAFILPEGRRSHNLLGDNSGCTFSATTGDIVGTGASPVDPLLGSLADNGGSTQTHELLTGSRAIGAGNPATPGSGGSACESIDQRGTSRPQGTDCDIGAYELVTVAAPSVPALSQWAILVFAILLGGAVIRRSRRLARV